MPRRERSGKMCKLLIRRVKIYILLGGRCCADTYSAATSSKILLARRERIALLSPLKLSELFLTDRMSYTNSLMRRHLKPFQVAEKTHQ